MKNTLMRSALCLLLLLALMAGLVYGANGVAAPIVAENERLAAEAAAAAEKALLGDSVMLYDRADPAASTLTVTADTVQSVYRDESKQSYLLRLSTFEGYTKDVPIELTLVVDFEGKIVSLAVESSGETKELSEDFLPSFAGQDSTLAGVELVAGVTFSSSAIRTAVNDGFNTLIDNGLFAAAEKSDDQLLSELVAAVYPGLVNEAGVVQGEELAGSGAVERGFKAANGSGFAWFTSGDEKLLAVSTTLGGVKLYNAAGEDVTASADAALLDEIRSLSEANAEDFSAETEKNLAKMLEEGAALTAAEIPGLCSTVVGAYTVETAEGTLYAFAAHPYGYSNEPMELYYVLDESGAITAFRAKELILYSEYFSNYTLDEPSYKEGFLGLTAESFNGEQALIAGATMSTDAVDTATRDVFEAFGLLKG
jgi:hypothetical protein